MTGPRIRFDAPRRHRWQVIGAAVCASALIVVIVHFFRRDDASPSGPPPAGPPASVAVATAAVPPRDVLAAAPSGSPQSPGSPVAAVPDGCARMLALPPGMTAEEAGRRMNAIEQASLGRQMSAMRARGDDLSLAMSHLLDESNRAAMPGELARLAQHSRDTRVLVLALGACRGSADAACAALGPERWAQADPGNAIPWLRIAAAAMDRGDGAAADAAMQRAAEATHTDSVAWSFMEPLFARPATEPTELVDTMITVLRLFGTHATASDSSATALLRYCRGPGRRDMRDDRVSPTAELASRRPVCQRLAEMLVGRSSSLLYRSVGTALGRELGWPSERTTRLRDESNAMMAYLHEITPIESQPGCTSLKSFLDDSRLRVSLGEIGLIQQRMRETGVTMDDLIARLAAAASAAAASTPASGTR